LMNPTTDDTAYFGGIEIIMCTWSARRCPSSIRHSFCSASFRNTSPKCLRNPPYKTLRRHFGIKTTWYLHSHFEWLKLSYSSIQILLDVCLAAHVLEFLGWTPVNVKLLLPPRQSRGNSRYIRLHDDGGNGAARIQPERRSENRFPPARWICVAGRMLRIDIQLAMFLLAGVVRDYLVAKRIYPLTAGLASLRKPSPMTGGEQSDTIAGQAPFSAIQ